MSTAHAEKKNTGLCWNAAGRSAWIEHCRQEEQSTLVCSYDCLLTFVTWRAVEEMPIRAAMNASISSWLLVVP